MNADQAILIRKLWGRFNYGHNLPAPTVLAERDWLAYVSAMTAAVPVEISLAFPSEEDALWAWPDGVSVVFAEPIEIQHVIVSKTDLVVPSFVPVEAHHEQQLCRGCIIGPLQLTPTRPPEGGEVDEIPAHSIFWISEDPSDIISGYWLPGSIMQSSETGEVSFSSRFLLSLITALGHRLTRLALPGTIRAERRRAERELPGLRVLQLATGASVSRSDMTGTVEWSHRWMVRGHWRLQPHGPRRALRKPVWIDPYVKGPEDKPLDVRQTVWKTP